MNATKKPKRPAINSSAVHVFDVLRSVSDGAEPAGVSDISRRLSLIGSTVFRALTTLEASGYLSRYRNLPQFELGMMPYLLNRALLNQFELNAASRPFLQKLAQETEETVSLNVRLGWYSLRLSGIYGSRDVYHRDRLGELALLHQSLAGRAMLAFLPDETLPELSRFLKEVLGEAPAADEWSALQKTLQIARENGVHAEALQMSPGFSAMAIPVRDQTGAVIACITINGPVYPSKNIRAQLEIRDGLERVIAATPERFVSPFAHIPANKIRLQIPRTKSAVGTPGKPLLRL
jgi:DNA-binding IclR family transcriptional regulator